MLSMNFFNRHPTTSSRVLPPDSAGFGIFAAVLSGAGVTLLIGLAVLWYFGFEKSASTVSPLIEDARVELADSLIPPQATPELKSDADLIMEAIANTQGGSVLLYRLNEGASSTLVGRGLVISPTGLIVTDTEVINPDRSYEVAIPGERDRRQIVKTVVFSDEFTVLSLNGRTSLVPQVANQLPSLAMVAAIGGDETVYTATGLISNVDKTTIMTNLYGDFIPGSLLVSRTGEVVGLATVVAKRAGPASFSILTKDLIRDLRSKGE